MAPRFFYRLNVLILILTVLVGTLPARDASAASLPAGEQPAIRKHVIKFYLDPALVTDMNFATQVLPKYVQDMNVILAKNTNRQLVFDPGTGIFLTKDQPHTNWATPPLPEQGFEFWAHAVRTSRPLSYGGYAGIDSSGAGVLAGMNWTRLYDPDRLTPVQVTDYWTQIHNMLHEIAHVMGAGYGEYYSLIYIGDRTGVEPLLNINAYDPNDSFWADKPDFMADPLLWNLAQTNTPLGRPTTRQELLGLVQFSQLTATLIGGEYRNSAPLVDLSQIGIHVVDPNGLPLSEANVKVWRVSGVYPYQAQLLADGWTDSDGKFTFAWGGSANPHNSYEFLRLVKVFKDGYDASASYISIFDTDITRLVHASDHFNRQIRLAKATIFADVSSENFATPWIEALYHARVTGGCSTDPLQYCPEQTVTRAQMAVFLERSMRGAAYAPAAKASSRFADVPSTHWAAAWIEQLAADGITGGCGDGNYCPDADVTRAQMAVFLLRSKYGVNYTPPAVGEDTGFQDVPVDHWAAAWIKQLAAEGITGGCGSGVYCPEQPVTRAQMAIFLGKLFHFSQQGAG
jgi:hypothetical protein